VACDAKIRPFAGALQSQHVELTCEVDSGESHVENGHRATLRDYAYPGSETVVVWMDDDRRNFTGGWVECPVRACVLPAGHHGGHAF
jgi:hypothetical protein